MGKNSRTRTVVIGDLNGAVDVLEDILQSCRLVNKRGNWIGGCAELIQVGDLFNRGSGARQALTWLLKLRREATSVGGTVTTLLGNHEVMTCLGNEGYCTEAEYLSFATKSQSLAWPDQVQEATMRMLMDYPSDGPILPLEPRMEAWKIDNVPGQQEMRKELSHEGRLGKAIRRLPIAHSSKGTIFSHSVILPHWAKMGVEGLNKRAHAEWAHAPRFYGHLSPDSILCAVNGPLWDRSIVYREPGSAALLLRSLAALGGKRMVVGHTQAEALNGGKAGHIHTLYDGRLVLVDVGLKEGRDTPRAALIIQGKRGFEWTPTEKRLLWED